VKWFLFYGDVILRLSNGVVPSQAIGLPILSPMPTSCIMRAIHSDSENEKTIIIAQVINNSREPICFTEKQMDKLYDLAVKYTNKSITRNQLLLELRGGDIQTFVAALGIIGAIIILVINRHKVAGFQVPPGAIIPPHLQWLYGNQQFGNNGNFGYGKGAGPRSLTVTGLVQNAGSDKKDPYNYIDVMNELRKQSKKRMINI
jgi:hypothetical protein